MSVFMQRFFSAETLREPKKLRNFAEMTPQSTYITEPHRVATAAYMRSVAWEWIGSWWWLAALPVAATAVALAMGSLLWSVAGFVVICLVMPLLAMLLYFRYALTEESAALVRLHRVELIPGESIVIEAVAEEDDDEHPRAYAPLRVAWEDISRVDLGENVAIWRDCAPYRPIIIPKALLSEEIVRLLAE
jgi:hypothetical protein